MNSETVLNGAAGLAGIQWAVSGQPARRLLRTQLTRMLEPGSTFGPLHLTRAKYKPGRKLLAYYTLVVTGPETRHNRTVPLAVAWMPPDTLPPQETPDQPVQEMQAEARQQGLLSPFLHLQQDIPAWGLRLQVWPLDPDFPQLVRLGSPAHAEQLFHSAGVKLALAGEDCVKITPIRYRPGERHVLRYQIDTNSNSPVQERLYAKLYPDANAAARANRIADRVVGWLEQSMPGFHGVRPAGMSAEDSVILYPHAPGTPLSQQLYRSPVWLSRQFKLVGAALACLHRGPQSLTEDLKENTLEKEIKVIRRASEHVQALLPDAGAVILRILERAEQLHARLPHETPTFTHSDFKSDHLLVSASGMTLIDFDTCALADPALDIGKFLADLEWWYKRTGAAGLEQSQQAFLAGYNNEDENGRLARARLYQSLILAKITIRRARLYSKDWASLTMNLIRRSEEILDSVPVR